MPTISAVLVATKFVLAAPPAPAAGRPVELHPSARRLHVRQSVSLSLEQRGLASGAWPENPRWFFVRLAGTQDNRSADEGAAPQAGLPTVTPAVPGVAMIGLDLQETIEAWTAGQFAPASAYPGGVARVRVLRSATALLRVQNAEGSPVHDTTATSKSGQNVEIRPLMDPTTMLPGSDLPVRVYVQGVAAPYASVAAAHRLSGLRFEVNADAKGIAILPVTEAGDWTIHTRWISPPGPEQDHWAVSLATLTFEVPLPQGGVR
jgi:hypothetical protein